MNTALMKVWNHLKRRTILIGWPMIVKESQRKFIWRLVAASSGIFLYRIALQRRIAGISQVKVHHRLEAGLIREF